MKKITSLSLSLLLVSLYAGSLSAANTTFDVINNGTQDYYVKFDINCRGQFGGDWPANLKKFTDNEKVVPGQRFHHENSPNCSVNNIKIFNASKNRVVYQDPLPDPLGLLGLYDPRGYRVMEITITPGAPGAPDGFAVTRTNHWGT